MKRIELDVNVSLMEQLQSEEAPAVLVNIFTVAPGESDDLLRAWAADAAIMKQQPGFISTQLHRGLSGSGVFLNYAVWQSVSHFRSAFKNPEFQAKLADYPPSTTAAPHLFKK